ncbi:hypothetical protein [Pyrobaculum neutrophilum]|uniref:Thermopsin n=1 Tax=Pyrobaculum neutrophilum (strain DSM 2338 / JCM 9278 / NBRC 100436 / V24Sta) TaxID=444157 RepID=B1YDW0_PYRNV|nr:hypothetical protein [Pyrobaculum neutrophilum]ACB39973.1 conserved hypothetical protein [Pyrobaculum neutrophilum V24Sta]
MRALLIAVLLAALAVYAQQIYALHYTPAECDINPYRCIVGTTAYSESASEWAKAFIEAKGWYGEIMPGYIVITALPNGSVSEYSFTKAVALFDIVQDPWSKVEPLYVRDVMYIDYVLGIPIKSDSRPVIDLSTLKHFTGSVYNVTGPGNTATVHNVIIRYRIYSDGRREFCLEDHRTSQSEWYRWAVSLGYDLAPIWDDLVFYSCRPPDRAPRNITLVVGQDGLTVYVDGNRTWWLSNIKGYIYIGPYRIERIEMYVLYAILYSNVFLKVKEPLGRIQLYLGNETLVAPPKAVIPYTGIALYNLVSSHYIAHVAFSWENGSAVLPGRDVGGRVYVRPDVSASVYGRLASLPYMAVIDLGWLRGRYCPYGDVVLSGAYRRIGGSVQVLGPVSIACTRYPVRFILPNGSALLAVAEANSTAHLPPLTVDLGNGTRAVTAEVKVDVREPVDVVVPVSQRLYRVVVKTPAGVNATWAPPGVLRLPTIELSNGTRYVPTAPAEVVVARPTTVEPRYRRQYLVRLAAPANSTAAWVDEGALFNVTLADPWVVGNGTMFSGLRVNGTGERSWRVVKPATLEASYAEVHYWVSVETPVNKTAGWTPRGAVLTFSDVLDLGNGTRLVGPSPASVVVDGPKNVSVAYGRRQYYVRVEGVEEWSGWADAGSVVKLNSTAVGGVVYRPLEDVAVLHPGVYRPRFLASYTYEFRDVLGVPNPAASVELCGVRAGADLAGRAHVEAETDRLCTPALSAWPVSPYTLVGLAAVVLLLRRLL